MTNTFGRPQKRDAALAKLENQVVSRMKKMGTEPVFRRAKLRSTSLFWNDLHRALLLALLEFLLAGLAPLFDLFLGLVLRDAVSFLHLADELVSIARNDIELIIGEFSPL